MKQKITELDIREILGKKPESSRVIDVRVEETYEMIRKMAEERKRKKKIWKKISVGIGSAAAILIIAFIFCVANPTLAAEIPIIGNLFEKVADVFPFGRLPKEDTTVLYEENKGETEQDTKYKKVSGDFTITLTEIYASNQALYVGVCVENKQEFPDLPEMGEEGIQMIRAYTIEKYSFRPDEIQGAQDIEGKLLDAHTFVGIMRIDYSMINVDDSRYKVAVKEAEEKGEPIPEITAENMQLYLDEYEIGENFDMNLEICQLKCYVPEGNKEWDGSWTYELDIEKKDDEAKVIEIGEVNDLGIGIESVEISPVEMTLNTIDSNGVGTFAVALDANGEKLPVGSHNCDELSIKGHDVSTVSIYICDYDEYMDELRGYRNGDGTGRTFQEILEERALYKTEVHVEE